MTVRLAPIRPHDLRTGDVLIGRDGSRREILYRTSVDSADDSWRVRLLETPFGTGSILDVDIERTGPHRHWWLDSTVDRP